MACACGGSNAAPKRFLGDAGFGMSSTRWFHGNCDAWGGLRSRDLSYLRVLGMNAYHPDKKTTMNDTMALTINGQQRSFEVGLSVADLLDRLQLKAKHVAVEVNLELVPRETHASYHLQCGDRIEVMTLVGGG